MNTSKTADIIRPKSFDDIVGQDHLFGKNGVVRRMLDANRLTNMIFFMIFALIYPLDERFNIKTKLKGFLIGFLIYFSVIIVQYLTWASVGAETVMNGVFSRYFIPLLIFVLATSFPCHNGNVVCPKYSPIVSIETSIPSFIRASIKGISTYKSSCAKASL